MKKSTNQSKISFWLNTVTVILLIGILTMAILVGLTNKSVNELNFQRFELIHNANRFMGGSANLTNQVRAFAATTETVYYDNYWKEINTDKNRDIGVAKLREIGITPEEEAIIKQMSDLSNFLVPLEEDAMEAAMTGNSEEAVAYVYGPDYTRDIGKINALKEQFLKMLRDRTLAEVTEKGLYASYL